MSVKPDDKEMARILANPDEITEEEMNMTEAEVAARIELMREQAAADAKEAEELLVYMARRHLPSNDNRDDGESKGN
jgi:hypothetical protein